MKKRVFSLLLALLLVFSQLPTVSAASDEALKAAQTLYEMGLFSGTGTDADGNPIFGLDDSLTREQAVTMLVRLLGKADAAQSETHEMPFTDVSKWARASVAYAYANGLAAGTGAATFGATQNATAAQYITFVLRALGYVSGEDFRWDSPWTLSDEIGLTGGEYSEATTVFTRGDLAILSARALDMRLKDSETILRDTLNAAPPAQEEPTVQSAATRDTYTTRKLSDAELKKLRDAGPNTLRDEISTVADAVAYLDQFDTTFWTGDGSNDLSIPRVLTAIRERSTATANVYTAFAGWCLSDDVPDAQLAALYVEQAYSLCTALVLPVRAGWLILSPSQFSPKIENCNNILTMLEEVQVKTLENLQNVLKPSQFNDPTIVTIFLAPIGAEVIFEWESPVLLEGDAEQIYIISDADRSAADAKRREEHWNIMMDNWSSYGIPDSEKPKLSRAEVEALIGQDIDTVAAAVTNLGDCMAYFCLSLFKADGGDIQFRVGETRLYWHFNYSPQATFAFNWGDCGAASGLAAYLLQGDYDVTGMVGMTFAAGEGGGHVINYVRDGNSYYMFDMVNFVSSGYRAHGLNFVKASTLKDTAKRWADATGWNEKLMIGYTAFDGDMPIGWDGTHISYLPESYKDVTEILMETPEEGYIYEWVEIGMYVEMAITGLRNIY